MVRLEVAQISANIEVDGYFNSIMVRLEANNSAKLVLIFVISIPLWCDWKLCKYCRPFYKHNFNSIMVRLEVTLEVPIAVVPAFQFHYGAIGSFSWPDIYFIR